MSQTVFENRGSSPARFVEISALGDPYYYATRRDGEVGTWGEWDMIGDDVTDGIMPWEMEERWDDVVEAFKKELGDGWEIVAERDVPSFTPTSSVLSDRYGVELPDRLARFYDQGEWKKYQGMTTADPPMWNCTFTVSFNRPGVHMNWEMVEIPDEGDKACFVALTPLLGGDTHEFLAAQIDDPKVPIGMWYHGSGKFYEYFDSLDEFLAALK